MLKVCFYERTRYGLQGLGKTNQRIRGTNKTKINVSKMKTKRNMERSKEQWIGVR